MPDIQYFGHACFRIRGREGIVICDPHDSSMGYALGNPTAHIVTVSNSQPEHSHYAAIRPIRDTPFLVDGPGEYEISGVLLTGVRTECAAHDSDTPPMFNTVFVIHLDDVTFCHLGSVGHSLSQQQLEEIGNIDVLFVPVGGKQSIGATRAVNIISALEPRLVIPMRYAPPHAPETSPLAPLEKFTHEVGIKVTEAQEKVTITASNLPAEGEETRILVMRPVNG